MGKLLGEVESLTGIDTYRAEKAKNENLPELMSTLEDKKTYPQFSGYLKTLEGEEMDYQGKKIKIDGDAIIKTLAEFNLAYAQGQRPTEPSLSAEQRFVLEEKHKEFQKLRADNENTKKLIENQELFNGLKESPEFAEMLGAIPSKEALAEILDSYFQESFKSGNKEQLERMSNIINKVKEYSKQFEISRQLDVKITELKGKYPNEFTEAETEKMKIMTAKEEAEFLIERVGRKWQGIDFIRSSSRLLSYCLNPEFGKKIHERQKLFVDIKSQFATELGNAELPDQITKMLANINKSKDVLRIALDVETDPNKTRKDKYHIFNEVFTKYISGIPPGEIVSEGLSQAEINKISREMAEQGIIPDDETFDAQKFESYFGQKAPDFSKIKEEDFAKILQSKNIETETVPGKALLEMLFGKMKENFGNNEVKNKNQEFIKTVEPQAIKTAEILKEIGLPTADFELTGKFYEVPAKTNAERKAIIVKNLEIAQNKITGKIQNGLANAFGIDKNSLLLNMLSKKVLKDPTFSKPDNPLSTENITDHLQYTEKLVDNLVKIKWEKIVDFPKDLNDKATKLETLGKNDEKLKDENVKNAFGALKTFRDVVLSMDNFESKSFKNAETTFKDVVGKITDVDVKKIFEEFMYKFKDAKERMIKITQEQIEKKKNAGKKVPPSNPPAWAI